MNKEQKEIELKKLEIENLKIKTEIFRILTFVSLTLGAGFFTIVFYLYGKAKKLLEFLIIIGGTLEIVFIFLSVVAYLKLMDKIKNIENKIKEL
ncbi:hypothetical protein [Hydrogenivirga sp. 128-5-R1-1]|uniref:hypothetical protein n=1 Tax=Hydrogenivirga sp. 128-5-R1-1 TaxID=392423 RepID=UPI00015F0495|nr:hypothetical protein [Hydrogenivirga sp. 128-5-R1-1]EDP74074.1 primosome assembly protein PriA [Hydrogenivirga sp. 128-5-R1-1]